MTQSPPRWYQTLLAHYLPLLVAIFITAAATGIFIIDQKAHHASLELAKQRLESLQVELTAALQAPVLTRDLPTIEEVLGELVALGEIEYALVRDAAGVELARVGLLSDLPAPPPLSAEALRLSDWRGAKHLDIAVPLASGSVQIGYSPQPLIAFVGQLRQNLLAVFLATALALFLAFLLLFRRLSQRLQRVSATAEALAAGRLESRAPVDSRDEVGRLGAAFNHMAEELQQKVTELTVARNETEHALTALEEEHAQLTALLEAMRLGVLMLDRDDRVVFANAALRRLWLIPEHVRLIGQTARQAMRASETRFAEPEHFSRLLLSVPGTQEISDSTELYLADGRILLQLCHPVRDEHHRLIGRLWLFEDVTRERRNAEQLIYLAERDGLTGLYNRRRFEELLDAAIETARRERRSLALMLFDLDEFKHLNDTFGHRAGDALLTRIASEVVAVTRRSDVVARLGGDEFAVLLPHVKNEEEVKAAAERIVQAVRRVPFEFDGQRIGVTVSLGIALFPQHADNKEDLVVCADVAMYQAKNAGRNAWRFYDGARNAEEIERLTWNQRIEEALERGLFALHFQGVYHTDGTLKHVEALIRMHDPEDPSRLVPPGRFIPAAERSGKIRQIDRWVITTALQLLRDHPTAPPIAVNVSGKTLSDPEFSQWLENAWYHTPEHARRLLFEITETSAIGDLQEALRFAHLVGRLGAVLCLDDFGTGFSSFSYLKYLPAQVVKIDGQFVRNLTQEKNNRLIVRAITEVARGMGKTTIAEFVEDAETLALLREIGVDAAQGYYLGKPGPELPYAAVKSPVVAA